MHGSDALTLEMLKKLAGKCNNQAVRTFFHSMSLFKFGMEVWEGVIGMKSQILGRQFPRDTRVGQHFDAYMT